MTGAPNLTKRILAGVGANASGQVVTTGIQLLSLPLFLHAWTVAQYGTWLMLSAVPAYFSLADVGVGTVAMNKMTMLHAQGDLRRSNETFQTALLLTIVVTSLLLLVTMTIIWTIDIGPLKSTDSRITLSLLILVTLLNVYSSLVDAVFRASGQFATGTYLLNAGRLAEWGGGVCALLLFGTMPAVAAGTLIARAATTVTLVALARSRHATVEWGIGHASRREFRELMGPGVAFLALPVGNAITIQGTTILVGSLFGAAALTAFNTYRTIARLPIQMLATFSRSLWPEMSRCFGRRDSALLHRLYRRGTLAAIAASGATCLVLYSLGAMIVSKWTGGKVPYDAVVFGLLLAATFANCAWQVGQVLLSATNCHEQLSILYILAAVSCVALAWSLPTSVGMRATAACLVLFEVFMLACSVRLVRRPLGAAE